MPRGSSLSCLCWAVTIAPLRCPPFLCTLASAQERVGRWEALKPVIRALRRYEQTLDRGLTGMRYHALLSRAAQRAGRKKAARQRRDRAAQIAQATAPLQVQDLPRGLPRSPRSPGSARTPE